LQVRFSDKPFSDFLQELGKRDNKHLPEKLLVNDKLYIRGIYDGLIDSDGTKPANGNRTGFTNTSKQLIELFGVCNYILNNHFPNIEIRKPTTGTLVNCDIKNVKASYVSRPLLKPINRLTKNYQICKLIDKLDDGAEVPVYDLEIDDDTHSFIANNVIVHNSACLTKNVTGVTRPQLSAVLDCSKYSTLPIVADGGIREIGDVCKAIGAGASMVMSGRLFAGCMEAPGKRSEGKKVYRGMASADAMKVIKREEDMATPEGMTTMIESTNVTAYDVVKDIKGGLQSAMSYSNALTIKQFQDNAFFGIRFTSNS